MRARLRQSPGDISVQFRARLLEPRFHAPPETTRSWASVVGSPHRARYLRPLIVPVAPRSAGGARRYAPMTSVVCASQALVVSGVYPALIRSVAVSRFIALRLMCSHRGSSEVSGTYTSLRLICRMLPLLAIHHPQLRPGCSSCLRPVHQTCRNSIVLTYLHPIMGTSSMVYSASRSTCSVKKPSNTVIWRGLLITWTRYVATSPSPTPLSSQCRPSITSILPAQLPGSAYVNSDAYAVPG